MLGEYSRPERQRTAAEGQAKQRSEQGREGREGGREAGFIAQDSKAGTVQISLIPTTSSQARHY